MPAAACVRAAGVCRIEALDPGTACYGLEWQERTHGVRLSTMADSVGTGHRDARHHGAGWSSAAQLVHLRADFEYALRLHHLCNGRGSRSTVLCKCKLSAHVQLCLVAYGAQQHEQAVATSKLSRSS